MSVDELAGGIVRNTFAVKQAENSLAYKVGWLVKAAYEDIEAQILKIDPASATGPARLKKLLKLRAQVESLVGTKLKGISDTVRVQLIDFGKVSGKLAENVLVGATLGVPVEISRNVVSRGQLASIIRNEPIQGALLKDWFAGLNQKTAFNVNRQIQIGALQNETIQQIAARVRGLTGQTTREATGIARTAITHINARASYETYKQNEDITSGYKYLATLDQRTTDICIGLDGQFFPWGVDPVLPPQHFNCRSTLVPVVDWKKILSDPADFPQTGTRATAINPATGKPGQVPASWSYGNWLLAQPKAVQAQILGKSKAKLFRDGKISLQQLVAKDGRSLTIAELEAVAAKNAADLQASLQKIADEAAKIAATPVAEQTIAVKAVPDTPQPKPGPVGAKKGPVPGVKVKLTANEFAVLKNQLLKETDNLTQIGKGLKFKGVEHAKETLAPKLFHTQKNIQRALKELKATPVKFNEPEVNDVIDFIKTLATGSDDLKTIAAGGEIGDDLAIKYYQNAWVAGNRPLSPKHVKTIAKDLTTEVTPTPSIPKTVTAFVQENPSGFSSVYRKRWVNELFDETVDLDDIVEGPLQFEKTLFVEKYGATSDDFKKIVEKIITTPSGDPHDDFAWIIRNALLDEDVIEIAELKAMTPFAKEKLTETLAKMSHGETWTESVVDQIAGLMDELKAVTAKSKKPAFLSLDDVAANATTSEITDLIKLGHAVKYADEAAYNLGADEIVAIGDDLAEFWGIKKFSVNILADDLANLVGDDLADFLAKVALKKSSAGGETGKLALNVTKKQFKNLNVSASKIDSLFPTMPTQHVNKLVSKVTPRTKPPVTTIKLGGKAPAAVDLASVNTLDDLAKLAGSHTTAPGLIDDLFRVAYYSADLDDEIVESLVENLAFALNMSEANVYKLAAQLGAKKGDDLVEFFAKIIASDPDLTGDAVTGWLATLQSIPNLQAHEAAKFTLKKFLPMSDKLADNIAVKLATKSGTKKFSLPDIDNIPGATVKTVEVANEAVESALKAQVKEAADLTPDIVLKTKTAASTGSNQYGVTGRYLGDDGVERFVKQYKNPSQIYSEKIANDIYLRLGLDAPNMTVLQVDNGFALVTPWLDDAKIVGSGITKAQADEIVNGFVADILTVNRDAVGTGLDNIVKSGGKLFRIDQGGAFRFRAQGLKKTGELLDIDEWDTLISKNSYYRKVMEKAGFASGDDLGIRAIGQIDDVLALVDDFPGGWAEFVEKSAPLMKKVDRDEVVKILNQRTKLLKAKRDDLAEKLGLNTAGKAPHPEAPQMTTLTAAPDPIPVGATVSDEFMKAYVDDVATWLAHNDPGFKLSTTQINSKFNIETKHSFTAQVEAKTKLKKWKQTPGTAPKASALAESNVPNPSTLPIDKLKEIAAEAKQKALSQVTETRPFGYAGNKDGVKFTDAISHLKTETGASNVGGIPNTLRKQVGGGVEVETVDLTKALSLTDKGVNSTTVKDIVTQIEASLVDTKLVAPLPINRLPVLFKHTDGKFYIANQYSKDTTAALIWSGHPTTRAIVLDVKALVTGNPEKYGFLDTDLASKLVAAEMKKKQKKIAALKKKGPDPKLVEAVEQSQKLKPDQKLGLIFDETDLEYKLVPAPKGVKKNLEPRKYTTAGATKPLTKSQFKIRKPDNARANDLMKKMQSEGSSSSYWNNRARTPAIAKRTVAASKKPPLFETEVDLMLSQRGVSTAGKSLEVKINSVVQDWIDRWAQSSLDSDAWRYAWQRAVHDEFKLGDEGLRAIATAGQSAKQGGENIYKTSANAMRFIVRQIYEETQDELRKRGIKEVLLYRGAGLHGLTEGTVTSAGELVAAELRPVSSYSSVLRKASNFNRGVIIAQKVPAEQILSFHHVGLGTGITSNGEWEWVVIGTKSPALAFRRSSITETEVFKRAKELGL